MSSRGLLGTLADLFRPSGRTSTTGQSVSGRGSHRRETQLRRAVTPAVHDNLDVEPGRLGDTRTIEVVPPARDALRISYAPATDGDPDAGEVVWTWVPYEENDGRGKDRPVLVIGRADGQRVYVVRLTSKSHDGERDYLSIGSGPWDSQGRPSWVDIEQVYSVHPDGMRREASALDLDRFARVADVLHRRYGWEVGE